MSDDVVRFLPNQTCVELSFWSEFGDLKLDKYKLSEEPVPLLAHVNASQYANVPSAVLLDSSSLQCSSEGHAGEHGIPGTLHHKNTFEAFKTSDKAKLLAEAGAQIWRDISSGAAEADPSLLSRFILLAYGDLKHYHFYYWFAFPALKPPKPFTLSSNSSLAEAEPELGPQLAAACDKWLSPASPTAAAAPAWLLYKATDGSITSAPLSHAQELLAAGTRLWLAFSDTSNEAAYPSWLLRNLLLLAAQRWRLPRLDVLCVRQSRRATDPQRSRLLQVALPDIPADWHASGSAPDAVGWCANPQGKLSPSFLNASPMMDPVQLAQQAVDLNLRLMRWRAAPELDIAVLAGTRCLLLGAGTLGCAVARTLLAWGVRHITLVDSGKVAFSNPVRQWLYSYTDCLQGGRPKAQAAAEQLQAIFPSAHATGLQLAIPMPGHPPAGPAQEAQQQADAAQLEQLVRDHDVVFLLTDTRESRWLPSLLCAAHSKLAVTSAVGFDSFVVMRHGAGVPQDSSSAASSDARQGEQQQAAGSGADAPGDSAAPSGSGSGSSSHGRLGCYFCNDVVAPLNSTVDRSLEQQCTVARPGLAPVAGALAVELVAALLQHPLKAAAPASTSAADGAALGAVPHMVRGQLSAFSQVCMEGRAFGCCTACSPAVVQAYRQGGWAMLSRAISSAGYLEEISGLQAMLAEAAGKLQGLGLSDEEEEEGEGGSGGQQGGGAAGGSDGEDDWTEL